MAKIIEESENLQGERIATVKTVRGEEFAMNIDEATCALAELFSDLDNERKRGWELEAKWFTSQLSKLRRAATAHPVGA